MNSTKRLGTKSHTNFTLLRPHDIIQSTLHIPPHSQVSFLAASRDLNVSRGKLAFGLVVGLNMRPKR